MPPPAEPSVAAFAGRPWRARFFATRPAFLTVTVVGVAVGLAAARAAGTPLHVGLALLTLVLALAAHAAANVVNDFHDALGSDALNTARLFPFSGGSRFIQNGVLDRSATGRFAAGLFGVTVAGGLWLVLGPAPGLALIGVAGLLVAWAYSAPPLALASRGVGELAVAAGWALVVLGTETVQRGAPEPIAVAAGASYGLAVAGVLWVNQFPDERADRESGKRTLVVRLGGVRAARWLSAAMPLAHGLPLALAAAGVLPPACAVAALSAWPALRAGQGVRAALREGEPFDRGRMTAAIRRMLVAAHGHGLLMTGALLLR